MLLERKLSEFREELMQAAVKSKHITCVQARNIAFGQKNLSFFRLVDEYLDNFLKEDRIGTHDKLKSVYQKFEDFLGNRNISLHDIDEKLLTDYQHYLRNELKNKANTIHTNLKAIKRIFSLADERGIMNSSTDPFKNLKIKQEKAIRDFLTKEEVGAIASLKLETGSKLELYRDMFLWTIYCGGLRVSDVIQLRKSNINGLFLNITIQKTKTPHRIQMPAVGYSILKKYLDQMEGEDGYIFGILQEPIYNSSAIILDKEISRGTARYNKGLKILAQKAGIRKNIGSHQARISFITLAAQNGIPLTTIQGIVKHAKIDMTAHYAKFSDNQGDAALESFEKKIIQ
jgi:site-specific recombinase XerD